MLQHDTPGVRFDYRYNTKVRLTRLPVVPEITYIVSFDDAMHALIRNLTVRQYDNDGLTRQYHAELQASRRSVKGSSAMLQRALRGFLWRSTVLVDHLSAPDMLGKKRRTGLLELSHQQPTRYVVLCRTFPVVLSNYILVESTYPTPMTSGKGLSSSTRSRIYIDSSQALGRTPSEDARFSHN